MAHWEAELADLVAHRGRALVGYATLLCGDRATAEDLVQDALVKVFSRLRGHGRARDAGSRAGGSVRTVHLDAPEAAVEHTEGYVRRAILTLYLDGYRRRRRWVGVRHLVATEDRVSGPESLATARADVAAGLAGLSPRQRACVVLRYLEDLTVPQIADALGCAQGTVKRHLSDAMAALQDTLQVEREQDRTTGGRRAVGDDGRSRR